MRLNNKRWPYWWFMIIKVGEMVRIDPYTEMMDERGNSYVSGCETVGMVIKWYGDHSWQEIELLVDGEILYLKDNWDKINFAFRRLDNANSDGRCNASSLREGLDYNTRWEHKSV